MAPVRVQVAGGLHALDDLLERNGLFVFAGLGNKAVEEVFDGLGVVLVEVDLDEAPAVVLVDEEGDAVHGGAWVVEVDKATGLIAAGVCNQVSFPRLGFALGPGLGIALGGAPRRAARGGARGEVGVVCVAAAAPPTCDPVGTRPHTGSPRAGPQRTPGHQPTPLTLRDGARVRRTRGPLFQPARGIRLRSRIYLLNKICRNSSSD